MANDSPRRGREGPARRPAFEPGDRVRPKCGGPVLVVREGRGKLVVCAGVARPSAGTLALPSHFLAPAEVAGA